jgi:AcrR family transcriptional regulator
LLTSPPDATILQLTLQIVKLIFVHYDHPVTSHETTVCPRPYSLARRQQQSDRKRAKILAKARVQLESRGFVDFSLESIARHSGVTRQTIYNLFGSRSGLLEAVFDQLAISGGMTRMRSVMQQSDPHSALASFVDVFCDFWSKDRLLLRRIHGIAAIDPEFGAAVDARNRRRQAAAARIVSMFDRANATRDQLRRAITLWALTSFEFFDALTEASGSLEEAKRLVHAQVHKALAPNP